MSQALMRDRRRLLVPPSLILSDQVEQRTYSWRYDSISDVWTDASVLDSDTISKTNYAASFYNTIESLQFRIPGNAKITTPSLIKLKVRVPDGQNDAGTTVSIAATSVYRKTSGLTYVNVGDFPASGNVTDIDITSICAAINKTADWYLQLQLNTSISWDSIAIDTKIDGAHIPYITLAY